MKLYNISKDTPYRNEGYLARLDGCDKYIVRSALRCARFAWQHRYWLTDRACHSLGRAFIKEYMRRLGASEYTIHLIPHEDRQGND